MSIHIVIEICKRLQKEGKKPSTALVKSKLTSPLPLAAIMKGIQLYAADPSIETEAELINAETSNKGAALESCACASEYKRTLENLQSQVLSLQTDVKALQAQVRLLSDT